MMQTPLPDSAVLSLIGDEAIAFAQSQFMNDVTALPDRSWQWNGWLTPKGRLVAFFACARLDARTLLLWLPAGGAQALAEGLRRFVFRAKVKLDADPSWVALARFGERGSSPSLHDDELALDLANAEDGSARQLIFQRTSDSDASSSVADPSLVQRWRLADLHAGVPYIAAGGVNSDQFVPQWLSLERLSAFNLKKGCYPGQEIVARMHYLGQSKRSAHVLSGTGDTPALMAKVLDHAGSALGDIVWAIRDGSDWRALAVLNSERANQVGSVEGAGAVCVVPNDEG